MKTILIILALLSFQTVSACNLNSTLTDNELNLSWEDQGTVGLYPLNSTHLIKTFNGAGEYKLTGVNENNKYELRGCTTITPKITPKNKYKKYRGSVNKKIYKKIHNWKHHNYSKYLEYKAEYKNRTGSDKAKLYKTYHKYHHYLRNN